MLKRITNLSGGQLVNTLKDGSTLRVDYKGYQDIDEKNITPYLESIEKKGLVKITSVGASQKTKTTTTTNTAKEE